MGLIRSDDIQYKLEEINSTIGKKYRLEHPEKERDWRTYEQEFSRRIKMAMKDLDPLVNEAVSIMRIVHGPGHPHSLTIEQRVKLLLIKQLVGESNRMFANMLAIFSMLSGIDVSYKTIERLYSDDEIEGILERTVTKQGTSAKADVPRRYLGKRVYVIITKSVGEADRE